MVCYLNIKILLKFKEFWLTAGLWRPHWDRISTHLDLGLGGCGNSPSGSTLRLRSTFFGGSDTETDGAGNIALGLYKEHDLKFDQGTGFWIGSHLSCVSYIYNKNMSEPLFSPVFTEEQKLASNYGAIGDLQLVEIRDVKLPYFENCWKIVDVSSCWDFKLSSCWVVEKSSCLDVEVFRCRDVEMRTCRDVEMFRCRDVELVRFEIVQIV